MKRVVLFLMGGLVGWSAYAGRLYGLERMHRLDRLPELLEGARAMQVSTHDRSGKNSDGWFGTYSHLYQDENGEYVLFDEWGAGCIYRMWTTFDVKYGMATNRFRVYFDNEAVPRIDTTIGSFFSGTNAPFLFPLTGDETVSSGGYFNYVPLPYTQRCKMTVSDVQRPFYYNFTWHSFDSADDVQTWSGAEDLSQVTSIWTNAGMDPKRYDHPPSVTQGNADIPPFATTNLFVQSDAGTLVALKIDPGPATEGALTNIWIRMTWDGAVEPQVYAPLGLFFGTGFGVHDVKALPFGMSSNCAYYCYFPMPFWEGAVVQLENKGASVVSDVAYEVHVVTNAYNAERCGHFYAKARRENLTSDDRDYVVLDTEGFGHYVGCVLSMTASHTNELLDMRYLEGDERIYIDGNPSPAIYGTGNEDYFNGGWYFKKEPFTLASHGAPYLHHDVGGESKTNSTSAYRFHSGGVIPFRTQFRFGMEHGDSYHSRNLPGTYSSVAFFYKKECEGMVLSAQLDPGDAASEQAFAYHSAADVFATNAWSYEGVHDDVLIEDSGRIDGGVRSFTVPVSAMNQGVILRRRADQGENPQSADVFVGDEFAGVWSLVDTNFSEGTARWIETEFLLSWRQTAGKTNLTIRIEPRGASWTEYLYDVYSLVPRVPSPDMDNDRLPDSWEVAYFNNIGRGDPSEDNDLDGMDTMGEYISGTSPVDSRSVFELSAEDTGVEFFARSNRMYQIWFCSNLTEEAWVRVITFKGSGAVWFVAPTDTSQGFYRVEVQK